MAKEAHPDLLTSLNVLPHSDATQLTRIAFAAWKGKRGSLMDDGRACAFYLRGGGNFATTSSPI